MPYNPHYFQESEPEKFQALLSTVPGLRSLKDEELVEVILATVAESSYNMAGSMVAVYGNDLLKKKEFAEEVNPTFAEGMNAALDLLVQVTIGIAMAQDEFRENAYGIEPEPKPWDDPND